MKYNLLCESSLSNSNNQDVSIDTNLELNAKISTCENLDTCIKLSLYKLLSYMELTFYGIVSGSMRFTELGDPTLAHSQWHTNTLYYQSNYKKHFSYSTAGKNELQKYKLSPELG